MIDVRAYILSISFVASTNRMLLVLLLACSISDSNAQTNSPAQPRINFRHLTEADGLASNNVNCILQDKLGFMWFGTDKGLNRYDGTSFVAYTYNNNDTNSLSGNHITNLFEDSKGRVWIGTFNNGVTIYDPITEKFTRHQHIDNDTTSINKGYVAQIYEDSKNRVWICLYGGGLELFDEKSNVFLHHTWRPDDTHSIACNKVKSILEIAEDKFLVGTFEAGNGITDIPDKGHINLFDLKSNTFTSLDIQRLKVDPHYRQGKHQMERLVHTIVADSFGNIWFGTYCGVIKYTLSSGHFICYQNNEHTLTSLSCNIVRSISVVEDKVYFGTEGGGLSVLDTLSDKFFNYKNNPYDPNSISDDHVRAVYKDRERRLWIGTRGGGINILDPVNKDFVLYSNNFLKISDYARLEETTIRALVAKNGTVYVGCYSTLTCLDTKSNSVKFIQKHKKADDLKYKCRVFAIEESADGMLWVGFNNMLMKYDSEKKLMKYFDTPSELLHFDRILKEDVPLVNIIERPDGILWLCYYGSQSIAYSPKKKNIISSAPAIGTTHGVLDKYGAIWAVKNTSSNQKKLVRIMQDWSIKEYRHDDNDSTSLSGTKISDVYCDHNNNIWVASEGGLDIYDSKTDGFRHLKNIQNLPDSMINCIVEDHEGNMWFATDFALLRMDSTRNVIVFSVNKDLPVHKLENKMTFDEQEHAIYFTANEGVVKFHPDKLELSRKITPIYISEIKLFNQSLFTDTSSLKKNKYTFNWNENFITINFTSLNYSDNVPQKFAYKLEGLNNEWITTGNSNEANFTNLDPGTYIFRVKGSTHEGLWDMESDPITITIATPWWNTPLFYAACLILVLLSIWLYNRYRNRVLIKRTQMLEKVVDKRTQQYKEQKNKAEKSEQIRQDFIAKVSHEIRTPINAVSGMADLLLKKNPQEEQIEYLEAISNSTDVLLHILNDVLDLTKIEAGKLHINSVPFSIKDTIIKVRNTFSLIAEEKGNTLIISISEDLPNTVLGDPYRLSQVILNLFSNALKFTDNGEVRIEVSKVLEEDELVYVRFAVIDTGIGIPDDKLKTLFEDYTQAHNLDNKQYGGTGLGLPISKNLIELMGGNISVSSKVGSGSIFLFELPFVKNTKEEVKQEYKKPTDTATLNGLKILYADDNDYNRTVIADSLKLAAKTDIDTVENGVQAIAKIQDKDYDIILMDVQMPVLDGIDTAKKIRTELPYPKCNTPIIALTATTTKSEYERCMAAGMNSFLIKPVKSDVLLNAIHDLISGSDKETNKNPLLEETQNTQKADNGEQIVNLSYLNEFCDGDAQRINNYVTLYLQAAQSILKELSNDAIISDREKLGPLMHNFRPKVKMMGMDYVAILTNSIENAGEDSDIKPLISSLVKNIELSISELSDNGVN